MAVIYTLFGYDKKHNPFVTTDVDKDEAKVFAKENVLTGYFLAPQYADTPTTGGIKTYLQGDDGNYHPTSLRDWTFKFHLAPGLDDGSASREQDHRSPSLRADAKYTP